MNKTKRNTYIVTRYDLEAWEDDSEERQLDAAIEIARDRQRVYHMPATWEAVRLPNGEVKVTCYHN